MVGIGIVSSTIEGRKEGGGYPHDDPNKNINKMRNHKNGKAPHLERSGCMLN